MRAIGVRTIGQLMLCALDTEQGGARYVQKRCSGGSLGGGFGGRAALGGESLRQKGDESWEYRLFAAPGSGVYGVICPSPLIHGMGADCFTIFNK